MRAAWALGARLAWQGRGVARLRSSLVALAALIGATILLGASALLSADVAANPGRYADRGLALLATALVLGVAVPVLVLAATAGRLSAALRSQRLAALRLLGLTPLQTRVVAVVETGIAALVGSVLALGAAWLLRPALTVVPVWGSTYPAGAIASPWWVSLSVVVAVPTVVVLVSALPERLGAARLLAGVRRAEARRPSPWRVVPLIVGAVWCAAFARWLGADGVQVAPTALAINLVGSVTTLGVGLLLVVPVVVRLVGDLLLRLGRGAASHLAARRIQAQPATMTRVVSGLLLGLFVVAGARCVVVAFETTPQFVSAERNVEVEQSAEIVVEAGRLAAVRGRLADLPGVRTSVPYRLVQSVEQDCSRPGACLSAAVISCGDLALLAPEVRGCRDDQALLMRGGDADGALPASIAWGRADPVDGGIDPPGVDLPTPTQVATIEGDADAVLNRLPAEIVIPPTLPGAQALEAGPVALVVLADPGRGLDDELSAAGLMVASSWGTEAYDEVVTLRGLVWSIGALVISLGLLAFGIAAVDRAVERRREVAALQVVGVPAAVLRRAQWIEVAVPLVVGSVLAVGAGLAAGATYLTLDEGALLPWRPTLTLALVGVAGGVVLGWITVLASSPRIRPELIRAE